MILKIPRLCNVNQGGRQGWGFLRLVSVLCLGLLLLSTYRLYKDAYFGDDDFRNLHEVQASSFASMIGYLVDPISSYFRPAGMMCYWVLLRFFDLNAVAYHGFSWCLHTLNTALVYFILKRLTESREGAAVGAALFASQVVFAEIYWSFGTIFEVVATFFTFVGILLWISEPRRWWHVLLASMTLLLAMKGKEMAVTIPLVWLGYDLLIRRKLSRRIVAQWILPCGLALWYGLTKAVAMRGAMPTHPYYMSINGSTLGSGFGLYLNMLFRSNFPWQIWCLVAAVLLLIFVLLRSRLAIFFQLYVFVTFLPVIFLVNHRFAFYWYLPFLGVCGFVAMLSKNVMHWIAIRIPQRLSRVAATCLFVVLCWAIFVLQKETSRPQRSWASTRANEYRGFVASLRSLPPPQPAETIYFDSLPPHLGAGVLVHATRVAFGRADLRVRLVTQFPRQARYRMRFQDSHLIRVSQ
jgi:hypothetical protein